MLNVHQTLPNRNNTKIINMVSNIQPVVKYLQISEKDKGIKILVEIALQYMKNPHLNYFFKKCKFNNDIGGKILFQI